MVTKHETELLKECLSELKSIKIHISDIEVDSHVNNEKLDRVEKDVEHMVEELEKYVTKERYKPVELVVYGMVGAILIAVMTSMGTLIASGSGSGSGNINPTKEYVHEIKIAK